MTRSSLVRLLLGVLLSGCPGSIEDPQPFRDHLGSTCPPQFDVERDLFRRTCGQLSCHTGGPSLAAAGLDLAAPGMGQRLLTHVSTECGEQRVLDPDVPLEDSFLIEKLDEDQPSCGDRMPLGRPPLTRTERVCLEAYLRTLVDQPIGDAGLPMPRDAGTPRDAGSITSDAGDPRRAVTVEAEAMELSGYEVDSLYPTVVRLPEGVTGGTASTTFAGAAGRYRLFVHVWIEPDGEPTLTVRVGGATVATASYPLAAADMVGHILGPFEVDLAAGTAIALDGQSDGGAWARLDRLEITP